MYICVPVLTGVKLMSTVFLNCSTPCVIEVGPFVEVGTCYSSKPCYPVWFRNPCLCLLNTRVIGGLPCNPDLTGLQVSGLWASH